VLSGTVYGRDGRTPVPGVTVYVYQTDVRGLYNPEGVSGVPHRIRGWANTDRSGRYEFHTIKPGLYPNRRTPAHIHRTVSRQDLPEWWLPEVRFEGEPLVTAAELQASVADGRFGNVRPLLERGGRLHCTRDLRL
jgi:protocatechuate 3,4-dioxygenase beta subunit